MSSNWGLKVVSNDGATVIIDGTSDMFKIAATGTLTATAAAHTDATATASLGSLSFASTPAIMGFVASASGSTADANPIYIGTYADSWVATSNGGTTNLEGATTGVHGYVYMHLSGTTPTPTLLVSAKGSGSSIQLWARYYVLQEVAL